MLSGPAAFTGFILKSRLDTPETTIIYNVLHGRPLVYSISDPVWRETTINFTIKFNHSLQHLLLYMMKLAFF